MRRVPVLLLLLMVAGMLTPSYAEAQTIPGVTFGGQVGTYGEFYGVNGTDRRRPPASARLFLRPTLSVYDKLTINFDFLLSTENRAFQSSARQSMNQYAIHPEWAWGAAHIGDYRDTYSPMTLAGVRVRGAGFAVWRGPLRFAALGGKTQRAVPGGATTGRFERNLFGGMIGVGDPTRSSIGLIVLRARDAVDSRALPEDSVPIIDPQPDTVFVEDTLQVGVTSNPFAVTPQENLIIGLAGNIELFQRALSLRGEIAGAAYTRDMRTDEIESEDVLDRIPGLVRWMYTPRVGSTVDYAYTLEATARIAPLTATATFRNIGPGYVSLGVASMQSDLRSMQVSTSLRFRRWNLRLEGSQQHDNLIGQKVFTTKRTRVGAALALRASRFWNATFRTNFAGLNNDAPDPEHWIAYRSWIFGTNQALVISRDKLFRSASVAYTYRTTGDENTARVQSESASHTLNVRVLMNLTADLSLTPSVGLVRSRFGEQAWAMRETYALGAQLRLLRGKWTTSLALGSSQVNQTGSLQGTVTSRYQLTRRDAVTLVARASDYANSLDVEQDFQEYMVTVRWAHRF